MSTWVSFSSPISDYCQAESASMSAAASPMARGVPRQAQVRDFHFTKPQDALSPKLFQAYSQGTKFPWVWVELYLKTTILPYLTYQLTDVFIVSYQPSGHTGSYLGPMDSIGLDFGEMKIVYA